MKERGKKIGIWRKSSSFLYHCIFFLLSFLPFFFFLSLSFFLSVSLSLSLSISLNICCLGRTIHAYLLLLSSTGIPLSS